MKKKRYTHLCTAISILLLLCMLLPVALYAEMTASLAWSDNDDQHEQIYYSRYADGAWENPTQLTKSDSLDYLPSSDEGEDGNTWVVWSSKHKDSILLMYTIGSENEWAEPRTIETGMSSNTAVSLMVDQQDIPWIVWAGFDGVDDDIFWSRWEGDKWATPARVSAPNDFPDLLPSLSMNSHGVMAVRWQRFNGDRYVADSRFYIDGSWQDGYDNQRNLVVQSKGKSDLISYPQMPAFVPDSAKAKMHIRHSRN